jgi:hypothetical protein
MQTIVKVRKPRQPFFVQSLAIIELTTGMFLLNRIIWFHYYSSEEPAFSDGGRVLYAGRDRILKGRPARRKPLFCMKKN